MKFIRAADGERGMRLYKHEEGSNGLRNRGQAGKNVAELAGKLWLGGSEATSDFPKEKNAAGRMYVIYFANIADSRKNIVCGLRAIC